MSCASESGMGSLPVWASWMIWSSSCSVNSGLIILRFVRRCRASGERICLRSSCFVVRIGLLGLVVVLGRFFVGVVGVFFVGWR